MATKSEYTRKREAINRVLVLLLQIGNSVEIEVLQEWIEYLDAIRIDSEKPLEEPK